MSKGKVKTIFDESPKKKDIFPIILALLIIVAVVLATVFCVNYFGREHLTEVGAGRYENQRLGVSYTLLMPCPYWVNLDITEVYAECGDTEFYKVVYTDENGRDAHVDPLTMIATADEYKNVEIYVAEGVTLPTMEEIEADAAFVYFVQVEEYQAGVLNKEQAQAVIDALKNGESVAYPSDVDANTRLNIYLSGKKYRYLRYTIEYFETDSGDKYLRDRSIGKCVKATEELDKIFGGSSEGEQ